MRKTDTAALVGYRVALCCDQTDEATFCRNDLSEEKESESEISGKVDLSTPTAGSLANQAITTGSDKSPGVEYEQSL